MNVPSFRHSTSIVNEALSEIGRAVLMAIVSPSSAPHLITVIQVSLFLSLQITW